jgi:cytidyltransferase-like protein
LGSRIVESFADFYKKHGENNWATKPTIALVPGSFKPPHKGHYEMIRQYSQLAYDVLVLVSAPAEKSQRVTKDGKVITPEIAKRILELYTNDLGNVDIQISPIPSPVGAAYAALEEISSDPPRTAVGKPKVVLGASKKDNDWKRWLGAAEWAVKQGLDIEVMDPALTAVDIVACPDGCPYSASNIRDNFDDPLAIARDIPDHVDPEAVNAILASI